MKTTNKISFVYIGANIFLIFLSLFMGGLWLINTQVAFICSMLIIFASFISYKGMVEKRLENGEITQERDLLDKIDDKYELFDEDEQANESQMSKEEFVKFYKQERKKNGGLKQTFSNLFKSGRGVFNPFRLGSYVVLCIAMMFLIRQELFSALPFLVGVGAVPISSLVLGFFVRE
ncbi:hypothetical protein [Sulfurospirillum arcachonense]|uniref:hypothetical protein n=1 Tax=Sulfurospirillum arcachonense TaxID=57666 RepID=UPI0006856030|nr:hypothetical protein [Sulfurospirillum arcachonense]